MDQPVLINRKRFPRLLPAGILCTLAVVAVFFNIEIDWIRVISLILWIGIVFLVLWQEISLKLDKIEYPDCKLCGSNRISELYPKDNLKMVCCDECGLVFARPRFGAFRRNFFIQVYSLKDLLNELRGRDAQNESNLKDNLGPKLDLLDSYTGNKVGLTLLDIGCGSGQLIRAAEARGYRVTGLEPGWFAGRGIGRKRPLKIIRTSLEGLKDAVCYDVVTCLHVIEHCAYPVDFMSKISKLTRPEGLIIVATPNYRCERSRQMGSGWEAVGPADHLNLFDENTLIKLMNKAGISVAAVHALCASSDELIIIGNPAA